MFRSGFGWILVVSCFDCVGWVVVGLFGISGWHASVTAGASVTVSLFSVRPGWEGGGLGASEKR
jgi:hypothetical protein